MPDFNTLQPVQSAQPDFSTLQPVNQTPQAAHTATSNSIWDSLNSTGQSLEKTGIPGVAQVGAGLSAAVSAPGDIANQFNQGKDLMTQSLGQMNDTANKPLNVQNFGDMIWQGMNSALGATQAATAPLAPIAKPIGNAIQAVAKPAGDALESSFGPIADFVTGSKGSGAAIERGLADTPGPTAAENTANFYSTASQLTGNAVAMQQMVQAAPEVIKQGTDMAKNALTSSPEQLDDNIVSAYSKAFKPTMAGKTGPGQLDKYNSNVVDGVKAILQNKDALSFENDTGVETGRTPETRGETADAVAQTKKALFSKYDAMSDNATGQGVKVNLGRAADALDKVINNVSLQITNPEAVKYAEDLQARFKAQETTDNGQLAGYKQVSASDAQDIVQTYNAKLKAFYRNPTPEYVSKAAIDAAMAYEIRGTLDDAVESLPGNEEYSTLKKQYGALSAIEKDVNKGALQEMKQVGTNASGLGKYVDIFSGGDIVAGIMHLNPGLVAKGVGQSIFSRVFQYLNSPDRAIGQMFDAAQGKSLGNTIAGAIDSTPSMGLSVKNVGPDPLKVAKNINGGDIKLIQDFVNAKPGEDLNALIELGPVIKSAGLTKLDPEMIKRFFQDVIQERNSPDFNAAKVGGSTPIQDKTSGKMKGSTSVYRGENSSNTEGGSYFSADKEFAQAFAGKDGKVVEIKLPPEDKIYDLTKTKESDVTYDSLFKQGYQVVKDYGARGETEYVVNPKYLKQLQGTKSGNNPKKTKNQ